MNWATFLGRDTTGARTLRASHSRGGTDMSGQRGGRSWRTELPAVAALELSCGLIRTFLWPARGPALIATRTTRASSAKRDPEWQSSGRSLPTCVVNAEGQ